MTAVLEGVPVQTRGPEVLRRLPADLAAARAWVDEQLEVPRGFLAAALKLPDAVRTFWQQAVRIEAERLHTMRGQVAEEFGKALELADETAKALPLAAALNGGPLPGAELLPAAREELGRFIDSILGRWDTEDDLYQLIIDTIRLPAWVTVGPTPAHLRPPQWWIDDVDDDPLKPPADGS